MKCNQTWCKDDNRRINRLRLSGAGLGGLGCGCWMWWKPKEQQVGREEGKPEWSFTADISGTLNGFHGGAANRRRRRRRWEDGRSQDASSRNPSRKAPVRVDFQPLRAWPDQPASTEEKRGGSRSRSQSWLAPLVEEKSDWTENSSNHFLLSKQLPRAPSAMDMRNKSPAKPRGPARCLSAKCVFCGGKASSLP